VRRQFATDVLTRETGQAEIEHDGADLMVFDAFERVDSIFSSQHDVTFERQQTAVVGTQLRVVLDDKNGRARAPARWHHPASLGGSFRPEKLSAPNDRRRDGFAGLYCGQVAPGSVFTMVSTAAVGICGRIIGLPAALWHE